MNDASKQTNELACLWVSMLNTTKDYAVECKANHEKWELIRNSTAICVLCVCANKIIEK